VPWPHAPTTSSSRLPTSAVERLEALAVVNDRRIDAPFILVTGKLGEKRGRMCAKWAADYILKDR